jgi:AraC-like DNA-binding protein
MTSDDRKNASSEKIEGVGPARGVLKVSEPPRGQFRHWRLAAPTAIAPLVQHIWMVRWNLDEGASHVARTLPYPNVHIVVEDDQAQVHGINRGRFTRELKGVGSAIGVKFRPGGFYPFLRKSVSTLRNKNVTLESVVGESTRDLCRELAMIDIDENALLGCIESFLLRHWPDFDPNVDRVAALVAAIEDDRTILRVEDLVARYALTKRSLQRLFEHYVGIGPKWVINRFRMHEAVERLKLAEPVDWAALALELGYFDQAHFNRDFKALIGSTPKRYLESGGGV